MLITDSSDYSDVRIAQWLKNLIIRGICGRNISSGIRGIYVCLVSCNSQLNNSKSQAKPRIIPNSKFKTPNSAALPSDTIFAFLTLNTPRSAH